MSQQKDYTPEEVMTIILIFVSRNNYALKSLLRKTIMKS